MQSLPSCRGLLASWRWVSLASARGSIRHQRQQLRGTHSDFSVPKKRSSVVPALSAMTHALQNAVAGQFFLKLAAGVLGDVLTMNATP